MSDDFYVCIGPCPVCGYVVEWDFDCPGYPDKNGKVMVCNPYWECGGAIMYKCDNQFCKWWYRDPNNRSTEYWDVEDKLYRPMGIRPDWLTENRL